MRLNGVALGFSVGFGCVQMCVRAYVYAVISAKPMYGCGCIMPAYAVKPRRVGAGGKAEHGNKDWDI